MTATFSGFDQRQQPHAGTSLIDDQECARFEGQRGGQSHFAVDPARPQPGRSTHVSSCAGKMSQSPQVPLWQGRLRQTPGTRSSGSGRQPAGLSVRRNTKSSPEGTLCVTMRAFFGEVELTQPVTDECFGNFRVSSGVRSGHRRFANFSSRSSQPERESC